MLAAALALIVNVAWAEDEAPHAALTHAVQRYLDGDAPGARQELQALLAEGPALAPETRREALLWLGDLLYAEGGPRAARNVFETLLAEAPDYPIDPVAHAPEVTAYFEEVRRSLAAPAADPLVDPPAPPAAPPPYPWRAAVPFGIGYFLDKKPVPGAVVGSLQVVGLAVSTALYVDLSNRAPADGTVPDGSDAFVAAFDRDKWINRSFAAAGVLAYLTPVVVETTAWGREQRLTMAVGPSTVTFSGQF